MNIALLLSVLSSYIITIYLYNDSKKDASNIFLLDKHLLLGISLGLLLFSTLVILSIIGTCSFIMNVFFIVIYLINVFSIVVIVYKLSKKIIKRDSNSLVSVYRISIMIGIALGTLLLIIEKLFD